MCLDPEEFATDQLHGIRVVPDPDFRIGPVRCFWHHGKQPGESFPVLGEDQMVVLIGNHPLINQDLPGVFLFTLAEFR